MKRLFYLFFFLPFLLMACSADYNVESNASNVGLVSDYGEERVIDDVSSSLLELEDIDTGENEGEVELVSPAVYHSSSKETGVREIDDIVIDLESNLEELKEKEIKTQKSETMGVEIGDIISQADSNIEEVVTGEREREIEREVKKRVEVEELGDVPLSNNNTYINVDGNEVHSPAYAPSVPKGATAVCRDGTYSFSQNRRGTCSRHGGVARWLN